MPDTIPNLFAQRGTTTATSANCPLPLIDPGAVWLVTRGHVDVVAMTVLRFGAGTEEDDPEGGAGGAGGADIQRTHLLRVSEGQLLFGLSPPTSGQNVILLGFGSADAEVSYLTVSDLASADLDEAQTRELVLLIGRWVAAVCSLCSMELAPTGAQNLRPGWKISLAPGQSAQPQSGVLWVRLSGRAKFMGHDGPCQIHCDHDPDSNGTPDTGSMLFPVGKDAWLTAESPCALQSYTGGNVPLDGAFWKGLEAFHAALETLIDVQRMREHQSDRARLAAKSRASRSTLVAAFAELEGILNRKRAATATGAASSELLAACRLVGRGLGIEVKEPDRSDRRAARGNPLEAIVSASALAMRRVALTGDWYRRDGGPILGFLDGGDTPVAILPRSPTSYEIHNPRDNSVTPVTAALARKLDSAAFVFYRTLPDRPLKGSDLLRFACRGVGRDVGMVALMGAIGGLLGLMTPLAIGAIYDHIIPQSERGQLLQLMFALFVAAFAACAFQITRNIALTRLENRAGSALQAAIWARLINLPAKFFTKYSAGDLALRAMGIDSIMSAMSTSAITTIVSGIFSLFSLALLFHFSPSAAVVALGLILILVIAIVICGYLRARYQTAIEEGHGKMASLLLQYINGIAKIRVAAAEDRAFANWAAAFSRQNRRVLASRSIANHLDTFGAAFPVVTYMVLFLLIAGQAAPGSAAGRAAASASTMSTGSFLAFMSAFFSLLYGMIELGQTAVHVLTVVPVYKRLVPVLEAAPEVNSGKSDPGSLRGRIEVSNVTFRYEADGPPILDSVDLHAEPGEFIAIVGSSGSGKSTLLRILLGFETPEAGTVAFDGFDAAGLDPQALRRQMGVVLQNGRLLPGDIFTNIVGSAVDLSHDDAWEAARLAGLDKDIEQMPMGMHTVISEGAGTFSGGQRQRLMIARALVSRPRIVFFDEATSALDNPTQAIVTQSLDRLRATRLVVAHRLSTIVNADRIYVLEKGKIVQVGTYEELIKQPGVFYDLVSRQIA